MTGWKALRSRADLVADQLVWGFKDLWRMFAEKGLLPSVRHACVASSGDCFSVTGENLLPEKTTSNPQSLVILEVDCLWGESRLPAMSRVALESAVAELLWRESPVPLEQMVAAWRLQPSTDGFWTVEWVICRRALQASLMQKFSLPQHSLTFLARGTKAILVQDQAASRSGKKQRLFNLLGVTLICLTALSLCLLALTPIAIKRQGAVQATETLGALDASAAPLRQKLDLLRQQTKVAAELKRSMDTAVPSAVVVEALSGALPDDTWLDRIDINESEIRIGGVAANANDLITYLGRSGLFSDVKATAPNVRDASLNKERFSFEMKWRGDRQL